MSPFKSLVFVSVLTLGAAAGTARAADGDAEAGQKAFSVCKACHTVEAGGPNRVGPNLHGVVGRAAGALDGFRYSDAIKGAGFAWDEATLDAYLKDPKGAVPGNKMAFAGVKDDRKRADLVAYLKSQSR